MCVCVCVCVCVFVCLDTKFALKEHYSQLSSDDIKKWIKALLNVQTSQFVAHNLGRPIAKWCSDYFNFGVHKDRRGVALQSAGWQSCSRSTYSVSG